MRLSYSFLPDPTDDTVSFAHRDGWLQDPLNPKHVTDDVGYSGRSVLELSEAAPQPWTARRPGVAAGTLAELSMVSKAMNGERRAWIYTPPGYNASRPAAYPLLVCFDGWVYTDHGVPTPAILDNLIAAKRVPPMMAVFIDQAPQPQRNIELSNNESFLEFVAGELLPRVRSQWRATADPALTIVCGSSTGGLASAFFAFRRPDVFGNVLSQSGAFWPGKTRDDAEREWLTRQFDVSPTQPVRFVLQVGVVEVVSTPGNGPSILSANRHLRNVLTAKGYDVRYSEVAGGHEPLTWRSGIADGLVQLLGGISRP
jgi:enterochelin esterase family protein